VVRKYHAAVTARTIATAITIAATVFPFTGALRFDLGAGEPRPDREIPGRMARPGQGTVRGRFRNRTRINRDDMHPARDAKYSFSPYHLAFTRSHQRPALTLFPEGLRNFVSIIGFLKSIKRIFPHFKF
jgi:hypothetical protein